MTPTSSTIRRFAPSKHKATVADLNAQIATYVAQTGSIAKNKTGAAKLLEVSVDFFDEHIEHELPKVTRGRRQLYPVGDLFRWLNDNAEKSGQ